MSWCMVILMHVTTNDGGHRLGATSGASPNRLFGEALRGAREESGRSQASVAEEMRAHGFATFDQSKISRIERGGGTTDLDEVVALVRILGVNLLDIFVASISTGDAQFESAHHAERVAHTRWLNADRQRRELEKDRAALERQIARTTREVADAYADWQRHRQRLGARSDTDNEHTESEEDE